MIRVANAPCSWGVLEFDISGPVVGFEQFLDEVRETGYAGTELGDWGFMPTEPELLGPAIRDRDLELVGAFVPVDLSKSDRHDAGIANGVKTARLMADAGFTNAFIVLADENGSIAPRVSAAGRVTPDLLLDGVAWEAVGAGASLFAKRVFDETGLRTVFHHHCAGYVETPGEVEKLLASTPADILGLVIDTGHYQFAGGYPEAALSLFWDRIWHVHYKDCSREIAAQSRQAGWDYFESVKHGVFCELGTGAVDFARMTDELRRRNYDGWIVVEQDVLPGMGSPKETAARNRAFLGSMGL